FRRMGKNSRDRIVDACLSEVLGGQRPPDLSDRILRNLKQGPRRRSNGPLVALVLAASVLVAAVGFLYARFLHTRGQAEIAGTTGQSGKDAGVARNDGSGSTATATPKNQPEIVDPIVADGSRKGTVSAGNVAERVEPLIAEAPAHAPVTVA